MIRRMLDTATHVKMPRERSHLETRRQKRLTGARDMDMSHRGDLPTAIFTSGDDTDRGLPTQERLETLASRFTFSDRAAPS